MHCCYSSPLCIASNTCALNAIASPAPGRESIGDSCERAKTDPGTIPGKTTRAPQTGSTVRHEFFEPPGRAGAPRTERKGECIYQGTRWSKGRSRSGARRHSTQFEWASALPTSPPRPLSMGGRYAHVVPDGPKGRTGTTPFPSISKTGFAITTPSSRGT